MAFPTTSFIPSGLLVSLFQASLTTMKIATASTPDTIKVALYSNSVTATEATGNNAAYNSTGFNTFECTGTNWTAPQTLTGVTNPNGLSVPATGVMMLDDTANVSVANTTISTAVFGCMVYDDTVTTPVADPALAVIYFGNASGYTTNNGTFGITWDTNGIWRITLH